MKFWLMKLYNANGKRIFDKAYIHAIEKLCIMACEQALCTCVSEYSGDYYMEYLYTFSTGEKVKFLYNDDMGCYYSVQLVTD